MTPVERLLRLYEERESEFQQLIAPWVDDAGEVTNFYRYDEIRSEHNDDLVEILHDLVHELRQERNPQ